MSYVSLKRACLVVQSGLSQNSGWQSVTPKPMLEYRIYPMQGDIASSTCCGLPQTCVLCLQGHWCAAIGQLPVRVSGAIGCNQLIVASLTHPPMGQSLADVADASAQHRVVALSLEAKQAEAPNRVKAFVFFGLPAISQLVQVTQNSSVQRVNSA